MTEASGRYSGIDGLRLIGSILVIALHVGTFQELPLAASDAIRLSCRWAVPFFFLAIGFFVGKSPDPQYAVSRSLGRLARILLSASVIFLSYRAYISGPRSVIDVLTSWETAFRGAWFHLWFIQAAIFGLAVLTFVRAALAKKLLFFAALGLVATYIALDTLVAVGGLRARVTLVPRAGAGAAFVWLGVMLAQTNFQPSFVRCAVLVALGSIATVAQGVAVHRLGGAAGELQLPLGAAVVAFALFLGAMLLRETVLLRQVAHAGRRFALGIYVVHPLFIEMLQRKGLTRADLLWASAAAITIATLKAMERCIPRGKAAIEGVPWRDIDKH